MEFPFLAEFAMVFDGRGHNGEVIGFVIAYVKNWRLRFKAAWVSHAARNVAHGALAAMFVAVVQVHMSLSVTVCH